MGRVGSYIEGRAGRRVTAVSVPMGSPGIVEQELSYWGRARPAAAVLFLPTLETEALAHLLEALSYKHYLSCVILVFADSGNIAGDLLRGHPQRQCLRVIRGDSSRLANFQRRMQDEGVRIPAAGRSRELWYALGYLLAASPAEVVTINEDQPLKPHLLSGSLHPLLSPYAGMQICKVCPGSVANDPEPALLPPFFDALAAACGGSDYLRTLASFFYPPGLCLAFRSDLVAGLRLPGVGSAQLALLSELQRRVPVNNFCRVTVRSAAMRPNSGQCRELASLLLENMRAEGMILSVPLAQSIRLNFKQLARDRLVSCRNHCAIEGIAFDEHEAELSVERFADVAFSAASQLAQGDSAVLSLPSWKRAMHAFPEALAHLNAAVERDFAELTSLPMSMPPPATDLRSPTPSPSPSRH